jgi:hypothetical protein
MNTDMYEIVEFWEMRMNEQEYPSDYGGDNFWDDDGWVLSVSYNPTQSKVEEIAFNTLVENLEENDADNVDVVRFKHWACGWLKQINVRPIVDGRPTKAGEMVYEYTLDNGYEYLERAYESEEYWNWERSMYHEYVDYVLDRLRSFYNWDPDGDEFEQEDRNRIVDYLIESGQAEVTGDGSVYQWCMETDSQWYEVLDEIMGNTAYRDGAGTHPDAEGGTCIR